MGTTLAETLAEADAMAQEQSQRQPPPAPPGPAKGSVSPAPSAPAVKAAPVQPSGGGMLDTIRKAVGLASSVDQKVSASVDAGVIRAPGQLLGGAVDTGADIGKFIGDNIQHMFVRKTTSDLINPKGAFSASKTAGEVLQAIAPATGSFKVFIKGAGDRLATGASLADVLSQRSTLGQVGYPALNQFTTEATASAASMAAGGEGLIPNMVKAGAGATVGMSAKDGKQRLMNASIGAGTELGVSALVKGAKLAAPLLKRTIKPATPVEAATDALDRTFASQRTQAATDQAAEAQLNLDKGKPPEPAAPQEQLPKGTRHTDEVPEDVKASGISPVARDANHILEQAGAAERIQPGEITDGVAKGDLWKQSPEDLQKMLDAKQASDSTSLLDAFGGDQEAADHFAKLDRLTNSMNPATADKASAELSQIEAGFTDEQKRLIYGIGDEGPQVDEIKDVLREHSDHAELGDRTDEELVDQMGSAIRANPRPQDWVKVPGGNADSATQAAFVRFGLAHKELAGRGADMANLRPKLIDSLVRRGYGKPSDVSEIVDNLFDTLEAQGKAPKRLSPEGKIIVKPETLEALDNAGIDRRAFAAENDSPKDAVIFKEEAEDGSSRVVGSMGKSDLDAFTEEVLAHRAAPEGIDLPNGSPSGQWKMAHLGAPYDAASVLRAMVDRLPKSSEPMKDADMMAAARDMADQFGSTPQEAMAFASHVAETDTAHPVVMKALQTIWKRLGDTVDEHINSGIDWATADQDTADAARQAIHDLTMFSSAFRDAKGIPGRTLRVLDLPDADSYLTAARQVDRGTLKVDPALNDEMPALPRTREELKNWLDQWAALKDNPGGRQRFLDQIGNTYPAGMKYLRTAAANFFTGMILSGPKTILLNVLGPGIFGGLRTLERTAGGAAMAINPLLSAADRAAGAQMAAHAPIAYVQTISDVATAFKYAAETFKSSRGMLEGEGHFPLDVNVQGVPKPLIAAAQADGKSPIPYYLGNILNVLPRAVWRLHGTTNEFALHMGYMGEVRAKAMLDAAQQGLSGADAQAHVLDALTAATDNATGQATDAASLDSAMRTTMVRQADPAFTPGRAAFDKMVQSWRTNVPELRYVLPIFQVPANSIGESIRRIPGVGFLLKETQQELSGTLGQFRQADAYGRVLLGAGFLASGAMMARQGLMTGAGPQDPADRKVWLSTHQPYSFKMGDQWVGYDRMEPVGPLLAIAGGFSDTSVYHPADENMTFAAVGALAEYLKDKAAVQGVADLLNFGGDPRDQATLLNRLGGIAKGFTVPAFLSPARSGLDPDLRVKRNPWDYIMDALPGASTHLDPVRNILGEDVRKSADTFAENILPITTAPTVIGKDAVLDEIDRLYNKTGYTPGALSPSGGQGHFDMRDVKLEDGHSLYDALMKARQTTTVDGQNLRSALTDLFNSPEYNDAPDGTGKVDDLDGGPREDTRGGMMQKVFTSFSKQAKADVANSSPTALKWMEAAVAKDHANDVLRGTPAKDLVNGLSIDLTPYEDKLTEGANAQ